MSLRRAIKVKKRRKDYERKKLKRKNREIRRRKQEKLSTAHNKEVDEKLSFVEPDVIELPAMESDDVFDMSGDKYDSE